MSGYRIYSCLSIEHYSRIIDIRDQLIMCHLSSVDEYNKINTKKICFDDGSSTYYKKRIIYVNKFIPKTLDKYIIHFKLSQNYSRKLNVEIM